MTKQATHSLTPTPRRAAARTAGWLLLGALAGGLIVLGVGEVSRASAMAPATTTGVAALCYLAAAVTGVRWMAWVAVPVVSALVFAAEFVPVPWWLIMALAGVLLTVVGIVGARTATWAQAAAMIGYFGPAVVAVQLAPTAGLMVAGLVIAAHAGWDVVHYRRDIVVSRSLALWCIGLDLTVGAICVTTALAF
jgi:hypothetical protein